MRDINAMYVIYDQNSTAGYDITSMRICNIILFSAHHPAFTVNSVYFTSNSYATLESITANEVFPIPITFRRISLTYIINASSTFLSF